MPRYGHDAIDEAVSLVSRMKSLHREVVEMAVNATKRVQARELDREALVDVSWALHEIAEMADNARKECVKLGTLTQKASVAIWAIEAAADPEAEARVVGRIAQALPREGLGANVPERDSPEWKQLMDYMGVPEPMRGMVRIKWPTFCDHIDELAGQGKQPPPGVPGSSTYPRYYLTRLRLKKGVNIEGR